MRCCKIKRGKKRMKEISKMREEKNEWMQGGVQKIKGRKKDRGARLGLVLDRVGLEPGRVERGYIRVVRPIFHSFYKIFLSLLSICSVLSPLAAFFSGEKSGRRWRLRRGGWPSLTAAPPHKTFFFFFRAYSSTFPSLFISGLKTSKIFIKKPRSKKKGRKLYFLFFDSDSNVWTWGWLWFWFVSVIGWVVA